MSDQSKIKAVFDCLRERFNPHINGKKLSPGHLVSEALWEKWLPQEYPDSRPITKDDPQPRYADEERRKKESLQVCAWVKEQAPKLYADYKRLHCDSIPDWEESSLRHKQICVNALNKMHVFYALNKFKVPVPQKQWISDLLACIEQQQGSGFDIQHLGGSRPWSILLPKYYKHNMERTDKYGCWLDRCRDLTEQFCEQLFEQGEYDSAKAAPGGDADIKDKAPSDGNN